MSGYTIENLRGIEDSAVEFGFRETQDSRFARSFEGGPEGLEVLAFGPRHQGDGEILENF